MYKDVVNQKCLFCAKTISGNQKYMTGGRQLPGQRGRRTKALKAMPEHYWDTNGLGDYINGEHVVYEFYLCPDHQTEQLYQSAFKWAQEQLDGHKELATLLV